MHYLFVYNKWLILLTNEPNMKVKTLSKTDENTRPLYLPPEKPVLQVKKQQLEPDLEQQTGSKLGKECIKAVYCNSVYLTYAHSTS